MAGARLAGRLKPPKPGVVSSTVVSCSYRWEKMMPGEKTGAHGVALYRAKTHSESDRRQEFTQSPRPEISVVVPLFDEAEVVEQFTKDLIGVLNSIHTTWEIVLVNDGSR